MTLGIEAIITNTYGILVEVEETWVNYDGDFFNVGDEAYYINLRQIFEYFEMKGDL